MDIRLLLSPPSSMARWQWDLGAEVPLVAREQSPGKKAEWGYPLLPLRGIPSLSLVGRALRVHSSRFVWGAV